MLDGLLGRGFSSKCKSAIKLTKARIDEIMRKRNSMQKFLKKDIADLLAHGLETNAYGRAEGLIVELNLSFCYDSVEQFCGCVVKNLSVMQKERECPEECREAVSSLMFAAARVANLPELRELRQIFTERYGNSLESFVNQEFVEKLALKPPTKDKKLQLMREIAKEFSLKWHSNAFEQKLFNPPVSAKDQPKRHGSFNDPNYGNKQHNSRDKTPLKRDAQDISHHGRRGLTDDEHKEHNSRDKTPLKRDAQDISHHGRRGLTDDEHKEHKGREEIVVKRNDKQYNSSHGRRELTVDGNKRHNGVEETIPKRDNQDISSRGKREFTDDGFRPSNAREEIIPKIDNQDGSSRGRRELTYRRREFTDDEFKSRNNKEDNLSHGRKKHLDDDNSTQKRDNHDILSIGKQEYAYGYRTKQKFKTHGMGVPSADENHNDLPKQTELTEKVTEEAESMKPHHNNVIPPPYVKPNGGKYVGNKASTDPPAQNRDIAFDERQVVGPVRVSGYGDENGHHRQDDLVGDEKPKPRSVRRRHLKPPPGHDYAHKPPEVDVMVNKNSSGRRRGDAGRGLRHNLNDVHEVTDDDEEEMMDKLLMHYSKKPSKFEPVRVRDVSDASESQRHRNREVGLVPPPARAASLPPEPVTPTEAGRVPARATSFQPEMLNPTAGHVHPKLPDYDDLAARFASLRGGR